MKILFISLQDFDSISEHRLYSDLLREFVKNGHELTVVSPVERRKNKKTQYFESEGVKFIKKRIGNIQKTNYIEKGISTLLLSSQLTQAIKKYCKGVSFDLILYATPPVTIYSIIKKLKRVTGAETVLMLKDIWPQEMVDLGLISTKGILYKYFKRLEEKMYSISDWIGYTSPANKEYLIKDGISKEKLVPINNSVDITFKYPKFRSKQEVLDKYGINTENIVFFYGGNLGKPQDIDYLISCLQTQINKEGRTFIICGQGTEYNKLFNFFKNRAPENMILLPYLPKQEYDEMIAAADVGMVFLNHKFTVPNCPSRFYTYMELGKAVLACTDEASDIRDDIYRGEFGWWCKSDSVANFEKAIETACKEGRHTLAERGKNARKYLENNYTTDKDYNTIINCISLT